MKRLLSTLLPILFAPIITAAIEISCIAGNISDVITDKTISELRITGTINAADIYYIADNLPQLTALDLTACRIESYKGYPLKGKSSYQALSIPAAAFAGSRLQTIKFPENTALTISEGAFAASDLRELTLGCRTTIESGAFTACKSLTEITISGETIVGDYAFRGCTALELANISGARTLGVKAFSGCTSLANVKFGLSLLYICSSTFESCALQSVDLHSTAVSTIGDWAFAYNPGLKEISLPPAMDSIGKGVFFGCTSLKTFSVPYGCTALPDYSFKDSGLTEIDLAGLTEIGKYSLKGSSGISKIVLPETLDEIGDNAMEGMTGLHIVNGADLNTVPALGRDVWKDIAQNEIILIVKAQDVDIFSESDQWKEFKIIEAESSSVSSVPFTSHDIHADIKDGMLHIESPDSEMSHVEIYNTAGIIVTVENPQSNLCDIDLSAMSSNVYIIHITLADGTEASIKLVR